MEPVNEQLLKMEKQMVVTQYKFGVFYAKEGQTTEDEFLNNGFFFTSTVHSVNKIFTISFSGAQSRFRRFYNTAGRKNRIARMEIIQGRAGC